MSAANVLHTAFILLDVAGAVSPLLAVEGEDSIVVENPIEGGRASERFRFHRVQIQKDIQQVATSVLDEMLPMDSAAGSSLSSISILLHGSVLHVTLQHHFKSIAESFARRVAERFDRSGRNVSLSFSLLRVYSWGVTDVLKKAIVERNILTPPRFSCEHSTTTTTIAGSEYTDMQGESSVLYRRLRRERMEEEELPLLVQVLHDALRVPDGHSAVRLSFIATDSATGSAASYTIALLPQLKRANHLFRDELLHLRESIHSSAESADERDVGRLATLLIDWPAGARNRVCVLTAIDGGAPYSESNLLQCWYGSLSASQPTPLYSLSPSTGLRSAECGTNTHRPVALDYSFATPLSTTRRPFAPGTGGGYSSSGDARALGMDFMLASEISSAAPRSSTSAVVPEQASGRQANDSVRDAGRSESVESMLESTASATGTHQPRGDFTLQQRVAELLSEKETLERDKSRLVQEVRELEAFKAALEVGTATFFKSVGEEILQELEDAESVMLTEVSRARTILQLTQASALSQEEQLLSRLSSLASEITKSTQPDNGRPDPHSR